MAGRLAGENLYHNIKIVLRQQGRWAAELCRDTEPRHGQPGHNTALGAGWGASRRAGRRWGAQQALRHGAGSRGTLRQAGAQVLCWAHGRWAGRAGAWQARRRVQVGAWGGSGERQGRSTGARNRRGTGARGARGARGLARAVHSVHSACFRSGLTQYCF